MGEPEKAAPAWRNPGAFALTPQQIRFFRCFGFLKLPGVFSDQEMSEITTGMNEVFADFDQIPKDEALHKKSTPLHQANAVHENPERFIVVNMSQRSPRLSWLPGDPRITVLPRTLIGEEYVLQGDSGSLFSCETNWHVDSSVGASVEKLYLKLCLYTEPLRRDTGALRVIPGTHFWHGDYAKNVRQGVLSGARPGGKSLQDMLGVSLDEMPSYAMETDPGDLLLWDYRIVHASFYGGERRLQWSIDFREPDQEGTSG